MFLPPSDASITLETDKDEYRPGEIVNCKVKLRCSKPVKARALVVSVRGEAWVDVSCGSGKHRRGKHETAVFQKQDFSFGNEREYQNEEYSFSYTIPAEAPPTIQSLSTVFLSDAIANGKGLEIPGLRVELPIDMPKEKLLDSMGGYGAGFRWIIEAKLDIALSMDVNAKKTFFVY